MKKILCIDGGGMRGVIPALVLSEIEKRTGKPVCSLFNMISGVSTGGLLALGLTVSSHAQIGPRFTACEMAELYRLLGSKVFSKKSTRASTGNSSYSDDYYAPDIIEHYLLEYFAESRLSESLTDLFLPSFDIDRHEPFYFRNYDIESPDFFIAKVARCIIAAPNCFEPSRIHSTDGMLSKNLMDGCLFSINPSMQAFNEAQSRYGEHEKLLIVSLGTGITTQSHSNGKESSYAWTPIEGTTVDIDERIRWVNSSMRHHYFRLQTMLPPQLLQTTESDANYLEQLNDSATLLIREHNADIEKMCTLLTSYQI